MKQVSVQTAWKATHELTVSSLLFEHLVDQKFSTRDPPSSVNPASDFGNIFTLYNLKKKKHDK